MNAAPVVVGVARDGSDDAVRMAADKARRTGRPLHLVHVAASDGYARQLGRDALTLATSRARRDMGSGVVEPRLLVGSVLPALLREAEGAALVVLERRVPGMERRMSTSLTCAVAAHLDVPVLAVPCGWVGEPSVGVVVAGVDLNRPQPRPLSTAITAARLWHSTLRVVAAHEPTRGSVADDDPGPDETMRRLLGALVDDLGGDACEVSIDVLSGHAVDVLLQASERADLVVLGRHVPPLPAGSRLGPVARGVLESAACPVLLTEPDAVHPWSAPRTSKKRPEASPCPV